MTLLLLLIASSAPIAAGGPFPDAHSAANELRRVAGNPESIAPQVTLHTPDGDFTISTEPVRTLLERKNRPGARAWIEHAAAQLERYASAVDDKPVNAQAVMRAVLARKEFAGHGPPTAWERMRQRISGWIGNLFARLFQSLGQHPMGMRVLFWTGLFGALAWLVWSLVRMGHQEVGLKLPAGPDLISSRSPDDWIGSARSAAAAGDLRAAIQCAYWAAVVRLQAIDALPGDRSRTPREYLRTVASTREHAFGSLVRMLERCWYARVPATIEDWQVCIRSLEALGCRVD